MFRLPLKITIGLAVFASAGIISGALAPSASAFIFTTARSVLPEKQDINQSFRISFDGKIEGKTIIINPSIGDVSRSSAQGFDVNEKALAAFNSEIFPSPIFNGSLPNQYRQPKTGFDSARSSQIAQTHPSTTDYVNKVALSNFGISYQSTKSKESSNLKNTGKIIIPQISEKKAIPESCNVSAILLMAAILHYHRKRQSTLNKS